MITTCNACPDRPLLELSTQIICEFRDSVIEDANDFSSRTRNLVATARAFQSIESSQLAEVDQTQAYLSDVTRQQNVFQNEIVSYIDDNLATIECTLCLGSQMLCPRAIRIAEILGEVLVKIEVYNWK